jgi:hypothetical protein
MTDLRQAAQQALSALENTDKTKLFELEKAARDALRKALEQPEQEPMPRREFASDYERGVIDGRQKQAQSSVDKAVNAMVSRPWVSRPWVGLTDAEYIHIRKTTYNARRGLVAFYRAIEAKLKEHNYD